MVDLTILQCLLWSQRSSLTNAAIAAMVWMALGTFLLVLLYHIHMASISNQRWKQIVNRLRVVVKSLKAKRIVKFLMDDNGWQMSAVASRVSHRVRYNKPTSSNDEDDEAFYGSCAGYREPLITDNRPLD